MNEFGIVGQVYQCVKIRCRSYFHCRPKTNEISEIFYAEDLFGRNVAALIFRLAFMYCTILIKMPLRRCRLISCLSYVIMLLCTRNVHSIFIELHSEYRHGTIRKTAVPAAPSVPVVVPVPAVIAK